jgi:DNA primase
VRLERARNLLAILIRHPMLLPEVEEPLAGLDLPDGHCTALRAAVLQWLPTADALDSHLLLAQLAQRGLGESALWATARAGLSPAAASEAQPGEALDGFWHFFALLRGEEELMADRAEAERQLVATNDPAAQQRLIGLKRALDALRRGEVAEAEPGSLT